MKHRPHSVIFEYLEAVVYIHARGQSGSHEVPGVRTPFEARGAVAGVGAWRVCIVKIMDKNE